jgi:hypothetical protein
MNVSKRSCVRSVTVGGARFVLVIGDGFSVRGGRKRVLQLLGRRIIILSKLSSFGQARLFGQKSLAHNIFLLATSLEEDSKVLSRLRPIG